MGSEMDRLIEAVEGGCLEPETPHAGMGWKDVSRMVQAYHGSLDAAKALHEALLGEVHWSIAEDDDYGFCGKVYLGGWFHEHSTVAARAWLLAILKAYRAQQQE